MAKPSICFVSLNAYPLLAKEKESNFCGGAEMQQVLMGQALADRGHAVSFVTMDQGQGPEVQIGPFRVLGAFKPDAGLRGLRFFVPRWSGIVDALERADADIYYVRGASFILMPVTRVASRLGKKVVFCGAADPDFDPDDSKLRYRRDTWLYWKALPRCSAVVAQNQRQADLARLRLTVPCRVIHNGLPVPDPAPGNPETICWVGIFRAQKAPERFLDLARRFPGASFEMIGGPIDGVKYTHELFATIQGAAQEIENLALTGFIPLEQVEDRLQHARLLVNTSTFEGFPNTFLQAWARGIPVLTFSDPDGLVEKHQLGWVAKDEKQMAELLDSFLEGKLEYSPEAIRSYFISHHTLDRQVDKVEELFEELVRG